MSRRATVQPSWLDAMLIAWGQQLAKCTGWYSTNMMLKDGIPTQARSFEPVGFSAMDFRELEAAIESLGNRHRLAITRAYKPWTIQAIDDEVALYDVSARVWRHWLDEAAALVFSHMERAKEKRSEYVA